jgi:hypothetical protein
MLFEFKKSHNIIYVIVMSHPGFERFMLDTLG